jgi:hypothetical protein
MVKSDMLRMHVVEDPRVDLNCEVRAGFAGGEIIDWDHGVPRMLPKDPSLG